MESKYGPISIRKEMKNGRKNEKGINENRQEKREAERAARMWRSENNIKKITTRIFLEANCIKKEEKYNNWTQSK